MTTSIPTAERPTPLASLLELRAPLEFSGLALRLPQLRAAPRGDGRPLMLIPGYQAGELSMRPLKRYLQLLGYDVHDWDRGRNDGDFEADIVHVGERCEALRARLGGAPVTLIGWSLGGVAAREAARMYAPSVREVITMGTPIIGGPKYTSVGALYAARIGLDLDRFEHEVHARNSIGLSQPVTSIYSRSDGVVGWRASVDVYNPQARNIRVPGSHLGLGVNARVWLHIARTLAASAS